MQSPPPLSDAPLMPHQLAALEQAAGMGDVIFINDDTGLGKSRTAASIARQRGAQRGLVVAPGVILQRKWVDELAACGYRAKVLAGKRDIAAGMDGVRWLVVGYPAIAHSLGPFLAKHAGWFDAVIFDESHHLKNPKSKRAQLWEVFQRRRSKGSATFLLSATPIVANPMDIVNQYNVAGAKREAAQLRSCTKWQDAWTPYGMPYRECVGWKNPDHARRLLDQRRIRRRKSEVLDLPPLAHEFLKVPVSESKLRDMVVERVAGADDGSARQDQVRAALEKYLDGGGLNVESHADLRIVQEVLYASTRLKLNDAMDYVAELASSVKVVVFGHHRDPLVKMNGALLERGLRSWLVTGAVKPAARDERVKAFKALEGPAVLLATFETAGAGIDLVEASHMVILEQTWAPHTMVQAYNRIHRIGQTGRTSCVTLLGESRKGADDSLLRIEYTLARNHTTKEGYADQAGLAGSLAS